MWTLWLRLRVAKRRCGWMPAAACGVALLAPTASARAETYPDRPVLMVVPFPPGGADVVARVIAARVGEALHATVVVENRPGGAGGVVGTRSVANASPDGYTMTFASPGQITVAPAVNKQLGYDPVKDFQPVALVAASPFALAVNVDLHIDSVTGLVAAAQKAPGKINFASPGFGTSSQLLGEQLKQIAGIDIVHVPYKGSAPAIIDLLSGQVQMYFDNLRNLQSYARSGKLKLLAVTSVTRDRDMPDVPTMNEVGLPQLSALYWNGILVPANTPAPIVARLNVAVNDALHAPDTVRYIRSLGMEPRGGSPATFANFIKTELAKWSGVVARMAK